MIFNVDASRKGPLRTRPGQRAYGCFAHAPVSQEESLTRQTNGEKKFEVQLLVFSALLVQARWFHET